MCKYNLQCYLDIQRLLSWHSVIHTQSSGEHLCIYLNYTQNFCIHRIQIQSMKQPKQILKLRTTTEQVELLHLVSYKGLLINLNYIMSRTVNGTIGICFIISHRKKLISDQWYYILSIQFIHVQSSTYCNLSTSKVN